VKKNLLNKTAAEEVIARVNRLDKNSARQWGTMTVAEMLHHCYRANTTILQSDTENKPSTLKQWFMKVLFLYIAPAFPKNVKGPKRIDPKLIRIMEDEFEEKRRLYIETVKAFPERKTRIVASHPFFGRLNTKEWGIFTWMHMDHHLRQFGV
jgi:hypothetical protein